MTSVTPTQAIHTLTPPGSSHGERSSWDLAVPLDSENHFQSDFKNSNSLLDAHTKPIAYSPRTNGSVKPLAERVNVTDSQRSRNPDHNHELNYLIPDKVVALSKKKSDVSQASEPDSLLDLYKPTTSRPTPRTGGAEKRKHPANTKTRNGGLEPDDSKWIHRDKLAQIEHRELEEAGLIDGGRMSRSSSTSASASRNQRERNSEQYRDSVSGDDRNDDNYQKRDEKKQRRISLTSAEEDEEHDRQWDLRVPDDMPLEDQPPRQQHGRPSTSRIPLPKTSPLPVSQKLVERESPLPRSREGSGAWGEGIGYYKGHRGRSSSVNSQILLDDIRAADISSSPTRIAPVDGSTSRSSPLKAKVPSKAAPTSGVRKVGSTARNVSQAKSRTPSVNATSAASGQRPSTSSGRVLRPSTSHNRPEGDAPWIASMYKPDPRLPPDQQLLPTHAKRIAQEQWEKEGKTGSAYDKDFRLLNTEGYVRPERRSSLVPSPGDDLPKTEEREPPEIREWPLSNSKAELQNPVPQPSPTISRPQTGGSEHGGYKTMPTIASPKAPTSPRPSTVPRQSQTSQPGAPIRLPEPPADAKAKKSCGCCIVM